MLGCSERRPAPSAPPTTDKTALGNNSRAGKPEKKNAMKKIENAFPPQVAGQFYTADPRELRPQIQGFLDAARSPGASALKERDIVGLMAPHAGYEYSGPVAGEAYKTVMGRPYKAVIVMALSHRRAADKAALLDRPAYDTPLGSVEIDRRSVQKMLTEHGNLFSVNELIFKGEHSLEVQLPFIQMVLPEAKIVPMIIAVQDEGFVERVGAALHGLFGKRGDVLFVASTDLTHFFPYSEAVALDNALLTMIERWQLDEWKRVGPTKKGMCGYRPVLTLLTLFEKYDAKKRSVTKIDYRNSGDTSGDKSRGVVGYGALAFSVEKGMRQEKGGDFGPYTGKERRFLMDLAKSAVKAAAKGDSFEPEEPSSDLLKAKGAAFVTLKKNGQLRGCIGHVIARVPLYQCVADVARSATIHDTRFSPVRPDELSDLSYEISVLTAPEPTTPDQVVVGRDGLIMSRGGRSGLLLPQVPVEWNWDREAFLAHTCRKAGLPLDCWKDSDTQIESFQAIVWGEEDLDD
jgi:AmmeMemoRadiSam system protein B/AmmeMemoRadiSam system protein A